MKPITSPTESKTTPTSALVKTLSGKTVDRPPIWLMRQAGRYLPEYRKLRSEFKDFLALCRTPQATTELALQPIKRFKLDAAILFSDILTIPHSLDLGLSFEPNHGPQFENPITSPTQIYELPFDGVIDQCQYVFEAVEHLKSNLDPSIPLIGFAGSPWTLACYSIQGHGSAQFPKAKQFLYEHPIATQALIEQFAMTTAHYLYQQAKHGADILFLIDTWGGLLSGSCYDSLVIQPLKLINQTLKDTLGCDCPLLFYSKGHLMQHASQFATQELCQGIAVDWTQDLNQTKSTYNHLSIQGNLDPHILTAGPVITQHHTRQMLASLDTPNQGFIASLGHGILPHTPIESVHAFIDTVRNYSQ